MWAVKVFRPYLLGTEFTVITDCKAVTYVFTNTLKPHRHIPWQIQLQEFKFAMKHRERTQNIPCDALAKHPVAEPGFYGEDEVACIGLEASNPGSLTMDQVRTFQRDDGRCKAIIGKLNANEPPTEFFLDDHGTLKRQPGENTRTRVVGRVDPVYTEEVPRRRYGRAPWEEQDFEVGL